MTSDLYDMDHFEWQVYSKEDAALVDSWLDTDAVCMTGMDEGFDAFHQYWKNESSPERGEYFSTKLVSENGHPFAVISYGYCNGTVTIMEIVVDPAVRGQGKGTAVINEFLNNAAVWITQPITVFNAVVFQRNTASQIAFYKAGFFWKIRIGSVGKRLLMIPRSFFDTRKESYRLSIQPKSDGWGRMNGVFSTRTCVYAVRTLFRSKSGTGS